MNLAIGNPEGFFGDKFEQLTSSSGVIESAGAFVPETIGIAQDILDEALAVSGLPSVDEAAELPVNSPHIARIKDKLELPGSTHEMLVEAAEYLTTLFDGPLILRSSGRGDAVGVGVYESKLHGIDSESITEAFVSVAGSYFTEQAVVYRQRRGLSSGFGMLMQPVVGGRVSVRDEWPHRREDFDRLDIVDRYSCVLPAFAPIVSGNIKIGTPRSVNGLLRLEEGMGSAVNKRTAPVLDLGSDTYADVILSMVNDTYVNDHIWFRTEDRVAGGNLAVMTNGKWALSEADGRHGYVVDENKHIKLADLRQIVNDIHEGVGGPCYMEFALTEIGGCDRLYILQLGKLGSNEISDEQPSFEFVDPNDVLADRLQAQNDVIETQPFGKLVSLDHWDDHNYLYLFDAQQAAEDGYLLVYSSRATHSGVSRIDLRRLKNVRGLLELESLDVGRTNGTAEEHLIGYSEQLGIPLLSTNYGASRARASLFGINQKSGERAEDVENFGALLVRSGKFRITGDPQSGLSLVAKC